MEVVYLEESLVMFLIINSKGELKQFFETASCTYLEGAMVETKNSWIFDDDKDGYLDIIMMTDLVDVEYPTENAPNISGIHTLVYRHYIPNSLVENISEDLWHSLTVTK